jgi:hypothetical protein
MDPLPPLCPVRLAPLRPVLRALAFLAFWPAFCKRKRAASRELALGKDTEHCSRFWSFAARKRVAKVLEKQRENREKRQIRQQNNKKKGKKNKGSKKNVSSNVRVDGFENMAAGE